MTTTVERCRDVFKGHSKYTLNKNDRSQGGYSNQFSIFYAARLNTIAPILKVEAARKWGDSVHIVSKIIDSEVENSSLSSECILIGTLYKEMHLRSSILDEFKDINGLSGIVQSFQNIASNDDFVVLEDDSGRIGLCGVIDDLVPSLVTGIIIALKGKICGTGMFQVDDYLFYGDSLKPAATQLKIPPVVNSNTTNNIFTADDPRFVLFVSGLNVDGGMSEGLTLSSQLLVDFIAGRLGGDDEVRIASRIVIYSKEECHFIPPCL
jgi:DNA polymerase delta subunit 2